MDPSPTGEPAIRFRAGKKRKAYRQRIEHDDDNNNNNTEDSTAQATQTQAEARDPSSATQIQDDDNEASVAAALRLRNARRGRLNGVGFKSAARPDNANDDEASSERALVPHTGGAYPAPEKDAATLSVANRFMHQTGLVADLNDRHMMEYIESRLSSRPSGTTSHPTDASLPDPTTLGGASTTAAATKPGSGLGAMQGHLMEIDLGDEARDYNVARTERATYGGGEDTEPARQVKKPRLGRDGKPRRPRNRRGSDAIKRDQLVEEILRENRLDVYEAPAHSSSDPSGAHADGAADDRLAEEFRQQFLEDVAQRQLKKKKPTTQQPTKSEEILKGPKLGGSRNVRAAMRDLLLKKEKEGKK